MCFVPKVDAPEAKQPVLPRPAPKRVDEGTLEARQRAMGRESLARGLRSTYRSGPQGVTSSPVLGQKTLLGQ